MVYSGFDVVVIVGFCAVVDAGVVRLDAASVDDAAAIVAGRFDVVVVDDGGVEWAGVVLLSTK